MNRRTVWLDWVMAVLGSAFGNSTAGWLDAR
jgi:hypothetical protein